MRQRNAIKMNEIRLLRVALMIVCSNFASLIAVEFPNLIFKPINLRLNLQEVLTFREDSFICSFGTAEKFWMEKDRYLSWLKSKLEKNSNAAVHVWQGDQLIGQMEFSVFKQDPNIGYVSLYYLVPEMRGRGIASILDEYAIKYLRGNGHKLARLSVSPTNIRAIRFYEKMGWKNLGVRADVPEVHLMERDL